MRVDTARLKLMVAEKNQMNRSVWDTSDKEVENEFCKWRDGESSYLVMLVI